MKSRLLFTLLLFCFTAGLYAQSEWFVYKPNNSGLPSISIYALEIDPAGNIWIGSNLGSLTKFYGGEWTVYSEHGLPGPARVIALGSGSDVWIGTQQYGMAKFDGTNTTVYDISTSELPSNEISALKVDNTGRVWAGTSEGVAILDGNDWTVYNTENSNLPHNWVYAFAEDKDGVMWVGTAGGLAKSDGSNWQYFNTDNSGLPDNWVISITIDSNNDKWVGTITGGLAKFSTEGWTVYNQLNSGLPANRVDCIVIDENDNKWIGTTAGGVAKFDGSNWTIFNESNSELPYNAVYALAIESNGNKWIGTYGGLAVYREGGVVSVDEELNKIPLEFELRQNYPNPFNPETNIEYRVPRSGMVTLKVYDILGNEIKTLVNEVHSSGVYKRKFNANKLSSGVYFYSLKVDNVYMGIKKMILTK